MEVYKKIVVPYDGSTHSQLALEHAAFLAKLSGGTISVLYVASLTSAATRISLSWAHAVWEPLPV